MTNLGKQLALLVGGGVEFIVIGGMAATAHGSARATLDLDVVYFPRTREHRASRDGVGTAHAVLARRAAGSAVPVRRGDNPARPQLHALLTLKRAAGRPKDLEAIAELELLRSRTAQ